MFLYSAVADNQKICLYEFSSVPCKAQAATVETVESDIFQIWLIFHVWLPLDEKVTQANYYRCLSNRCHGNQGNRFSEQKSQFCCLKNRFLAHI